MIVDLKLYPAMKDSGVAWLGEVPEHWIIERLKSSVDNILDQGTELRGADVHIALEHVESWTGQIRCADSDSSFDSQLKRFRSGDVLFGKLRPYLAKVARPTSGGCCVGEFLVLRPRHQNFRESYLEVFLRSKPIVDAVNSSTFGAKMPRADWQFIGGMSVVRPPLSEQTAIVRFLDHADRRIRRYIHAKQKLIGLLEEQKQAAIHRAVTRGLDPNVRLKPSGVEWLGDVPAHWERRRLKALLRPVDRRSLTGRETLLSVRRNQGVVIYADHFAHPSQSRSLVGFKLLKVGQLVVNRLQANNGLIVCSTLDGLVSPDYSVFDERLPVQMRFLSDLCRTSSYRAHFRRESTGLGTGTAGFLRLYDDKFLDTLVFLPPLLEQVAIVEYLDKAIATATTISRTRRQIELMEEYRTRLIANVVTGKLDVRRVMVNLPDDLNEVKSTDGIPNGA